MIYVNNKPTETSATTLLKLAEEMNLPARGVAVAVENKMIQRAAWAETALTEGVHIVIIKAACGG